jgi:two-component system, cell cycle response regulator DivK
MSQSTPLRDVAPKPDDEAREEARGELESLQGGRNVGPPPRSRRLGRVLIVDDSVDAREMYALYFRTVGYDAATAHDGHTAIEMALRLNPDVIVMDLAMPGISGIDAADRIKRDARTRRIAIILLTGHGARAIQEGALETGIDAFLTKPCLPEDLESHVRRLIQNQRRV